MSTEHCATCQQVAVLSGLTVVVVTGSSAAAIVVVVCTATGLMSQMVPDA